LKNQALSGVEKGASENKVMGDVINTLHDFMLRTESITYILIVAALCGFIFFWRFLSERDEGRDYLGADRPGEHHH
jgi:hypothetical protein